MVEQNIADESLLCLRKVLVNMKQIGWSEEKTVQVLAVDEQAVREAILARHSVSEQALFAAAFKYAATQLQCIISLFLLVHYSS